ncbi:MAG: DUF5819 family protein [Myxococcota bacterium]
MSAGQVALRLLVGALALAYLLLTVVYNLPPSPGRSSAQALLDATMGRFFPQNWRLFGPEPVAENVAVLVSCIGPADFDELQLREQAGVSTDWAGPWVDLTTPLIEAHQRSRLSAYDRLSRVLTSAARMGSGVPAEFQLVSSACEHGDQLACESLTLQVENVRKVSRKYIARIAGSYCKQVEPAAVAVGLRVRKRPAIKWSKRHESATPDPTDVGFGLFPIPADVAPATIFQP